MAYEELKFNISNLRLYTLHIEYRLFSGFGF